MRHPGEASDMVRAAAPAGLALSVVVVELAGGAALGRCLARVAAVAAGAEIVAVRRNPGAPLPEGVRAVEAPVGSGSETVPVRRAWGVTVAAGAVVALVEDTTRLGDGWASALVAAFADPQVAAAAGSVAVDPALPARYRALGRLEYGRFAGPPVAAGWRTPPGNAMAFRRAALLEVAPDRLVEHEAAAALAARGRRVAFVPEARCVYAVPDRHGARLATRFGHGRLYGAAQAAGRPMAARASGSAVRAAAVPGLLACRTVRAARGTGVPWATLGPELPWIAAMAVAWGLGEAAGWLAGVGRAAGSWR